MVYYKHIDHAICRVKKSCDLKRTSYKNLRQQLQKPEAKCVLLHFMSNNMKIRSIKIVKLEHSKERTLEKEFNDTTSE